MAFSVNTENIVEGLATWEVAGTYLNFISVEIGGDSSYSKGGESVDLSDYFSTIYVVAPAVAHVPQGSEYPLIAATAWSDPSDVTLQCFEGDTESADTRDLSSAKWRVFVLGQKVIT